MGLLGADGLLWGCCRGGGGVLVPWGLGGMLVPWGQGVGWVPRLEFPRVPSIPQPQECDGVEVLLPNLQPCFVSSSGQIAGGARGLLSATPSKRCCSSRQWQLCAERGRIGPPPHSPRCSGSPLVPVPALTQQSGGAGGARGCPGAGCPG